MEINFFYIIIRLCFCSSKLQKNVMQSNFTASDIPNPLAVCCFPDQFIYFVINFFWRVSSFIPYVFNSLKKVFESSLCISSVPSLNTGLC